MDICSRTSASLIPVSARTSSGMLPEAALGQFGLDLIELGIGLMPVALLVQQDAAHDEFSTMRSRSWGSGFQLVRADLASRLLHEKVEYLVDIPGGNVVVVD